MPPSLERGRVNNNNITIILSDLRRNSDKTKRGSNIISLRGLLQPPIKLHFFVAKNKKPHTIAEKLIMPTTKVLVKHVIGNEALSKFNSVSASNNTIKRLITEISADINEQVITEVQDSKHGFAIQLDKSTDVSNYAQLLVYVRYTTCTKDAIRSELLLTNEMRTTIKKRTCSSLFTVSKKLFSNKPS